MNGDKEIAHGASGFGHDDTHRQATPRRGLRHRLQRFADEDDGAAVILTLFCFIAMVLMAGLGIDTMRHEMERTRLQATLDSAVLAGAGAPRGTSVTDIKGIVEDYFGKQGMASYLHAIDTDGQGGDDDIVTSLNSTRVYAEASMSIDTYLMKLSGVETLSAAGKSEAQVRQPKLEIVLVLDVSGSMYGTKLANLKSAAKEFVSTILGSSASGNTVISVVPFSWSATPSWTVFDTLAVDRTHNYSTCLKFKDNDYNHATLTSGASSLSEGIPVDHMIYTSVYGTFDNLNDAWRSCYTDDYMEILPYSISESALHAKIDSLQANGNTSGHQGINWGSALLDPTFRKVSGNLITSGEIDSSLTNVPADYDEPETLKVVVMMGDGANTTSYFFDQSNPKYRGKHSDLFLVKYQDRLFKYAYHIYKQQRRSYDESKCSNKKWECVYEAYGPEESVYYLRYSGGGWYYSIEDAQWITDTEFNSLDETLPGYISTEQLSWEMAWGLITPDYYGDVTGDWGPWNDFVGSEYETGTEKDMHMKNVCTATKTNGVVVYSIGFEVPSGGRAERVLTDCASSPNHYYPASTTDIGAAFSSIASNVQNLRLTQ
ncbi:pilus assembly protein TadG-related protein [Roseovarius salis]|uniref:pilus assembly protein TadG-related protein n=1 Tax=Roseovarius salis TaxID=3376063 RepID=UPI0037CB3936